MLSAPPHATYTHRRHVQSAAAPVDERLDDAIDVLREVNKGGGRVV